MASLSSLPSGRTLVHLAWGLASWLPAWLFVRTHVLNTFAVAGPSMQPLLSPDYAASGARDEVLGWMWRPHRHLSRGSVVGFWTPHDPRKFAIKRVVALEGDSVRPHPRYPTGQALVQVPPGHVWVEGEDAFRSVDSNDFGPLSTSLIMARVTHVLWPLSRAGRIPVAEKGGARVVRREGERPVVWQ
ncbi:MAG: hypothetical protein M1832_004038 [Thelocarpon impressellum]|nr:MAG: hypothetical protein M1832_004038 [Thelocarpon impressellum]